jgi:hypothetical protein
LTKRTNGVGISVLIIFQTDEDGDDVRLKKSALVHVTVTEESRRPITAIKKVR